MHNSKDGIIFIHGNSSSSKVFDQTVQSKELKHNALAINLKGHGNSSERSSDYTFKDYFEQIMIAIQQIEGRVLLVGNSLGGHLAIRIAPSVAHLQGICVFGTPPLKKPINIEDAYIASEHGAISFFEDPAEGLVQDAFRAATSIPDVQNLLIEDFLASDGKVRANLAGQLLDEENQVDEVAIMKELTCKKYFLHGENDIFANGNYIEVIAKETKAEFTLFKNSGHYVSVEMPEEFTKYINGICDDIFD